MRDDYKYSLQRIVFYRHADPDAPVSSFGEEGPESTPGVVTDVQPDPDDPDTWSYTIRNWYNGEIRTVREADIHCGAGPTHERGSARKQTREEQPETAGADLVNFVRHEISDLIGREEEQDAAIAQGRDLPLEAGDYIRLSSEFRPELEPYHGLYAKILGVETPDIGALETRPERKAGTRTHRIQHRYQVLLENGTRLEIYDPEIKNYYTSRGRSTVLNWRAALFLADIFGDTPPYHVDYDFLESHLFTRAELEGLPKERLVDLLINLRYVKGQLSLQDHESQQHDLLSASEGYLIDNILFVSRFDMHRNRPMTHDEILERLESQDRFRQLLEESHD